LRTVLKWGYGAVFENQFKPPTRHEVPRAFLGEATHQASATVELVAVYLIYGSLFFVLDGIQTTATGALRGLNDTRVPLIMALIGFWVIGFASAYGLAFVAGYGPVGIWVGLSLGLTVFALLVMCRFHLLTRRHYLPS
jgi:multidrug resistance protein, MATE family